MTLFIIGVWVGSIITWLTLAVLEVASRADDEGGAE